MNFLVIITLLSIVPKFSHKAFVCAFPQNNVNENFSALLGNSSAAKTQVSQLKSAKDGDFKVNLASEGKAKEDVSLEKNENSIERKGFQAGEEKKNATPIKQPEKKIDIPSQTVEKTTQKEEKDSVKESSITKSKNITNPVKEIQNSNIEVPVKIHQELKQTATVNNSKSIDQKTTNNSRPIQLQATTSEVKNNLPEKDKTIVTTTKSIIKIPKTSKAPAPVLNGFPKISEDNDIKEDSRPFLENDEKENTGTKVTDKLDTSKSDDITLEEKGNNNVGYNVAIPLENDDNSHFFAYMLTLMVMAIICYLLFHNKKRIVALMIEGRSGKNSGRRRNSRAKYHKLDNNLEEAMSTTRSSNTSLNQIY